MSVELKNWKELCKEKDEKIKELEGKFDLIVEKLEEYAESNEIVARRLKCISARKKTIERLVRADTFRKAVKIVKGVMNERD